MDEHSFGFMSGVVTVLTAIIGVATLAVVVSRNSNTASLIQNTGTAVSSMLDVAESPVTETKSTPNLTYSSRSTYGELGDDFGATASVY